MRTTASILVLAALGALFAAKSLLRDNEGCAFWAIPFLAITLVGQMWARRYRAFLPEGERERLRLSGYIDGVTSGMGPVETKLFCLALGVWLFCLGLRLILHVYG